MIWQYLYTSDADNTTATWNVLGTLVGTLTAAPGTTSSSGNQNGVLQTVTARWLRISYNATLSSDSYFANASGSGTISATAVPEPGTLVTLGSMLAPLGICFIRRRRAL